MEMVAEEEKRWKAEKTAETGRRFLKRGFLKKIRECFDYLLADFSSSVTVPSLPPRPINRLKKAELLARFSDID